MTAWTPVPVPGDVACLPIESFDARTPPGRVAGCRVRRHRLAPCRRDGRRPHRGSRRSASAQRAVRDAAPAGADRLPRRWPPPAPPRPVSGAPGAAADDVDPVRQMLADEAAAGDDHRRARRSTSAASPPARCVLRVEGAAPGTVVDVAAAEHLTTDGALAPLGQHAGFRYVCAGGPVETFETFDVIGTRHLHAAVRVARTGTVPPGAVRAGPAPPAPRRCVLRLLRPVARTRSTPPASAPSTCARSTPTSTARPASSGPGPGTRSSTRWSTSCPTRTGRWPGGTPQLAAEPRADGMLAMAPASDFGLDDRTFVPDWSLHWVRSVHNLFRYTGDRELVAELLPVVVAGPPVVRVLPGRRRPAPRRLWLGTPRLGQRLRDRDVVDPQRPVGPGARGPGRDGRRGWATTAPRPGRRAVVPAWSPASTPSGTTTGASTSTTWSTGWPSGRRPSTGGGGAGRRPRCPPATRPGGRPPDATVRAWSGTPG